uniref:Uncharacterized protein n=1 Tax=Pyxicephalus adspersus TaxID=30357 RepID=A0AAV3AP22_PYXAD|nr:TPA: hypothetical protein GDO54_012302 [Pyxicephalus adspersus]
MVGPTSCTSGTKMLEACLAVKWKWVASVGRKEDDPQRVILADLLLIFLDQSQVLEGSAKVKVSFFFLFLFCLGTL